MDLLRNGCLTKGKEKNANYSMSFVGLYFARYNPDKDHIDPDFSKLTNFYKINFSVARALWKMAHQGMAGQTYI
jgi:hypothetical protein